MRSNNKVTDIAAVGEEITDDELATVGGGQRGDVWIILWSDGTWSYAVEL